MIAPGLKIIRGPSFTRTGSLADFPLSSQFDEMDAVLVFDKALVPWDRVFLHENLELVAKIYAARASAT